MEADQPSPGAATAAQLDADPVLAAVPGVVALIGADGRVRWINDQVTALSGHRPADLIGTDMFQYLDLEANPLALESVGYALETPGIRLATLLGFRTSTGATVAVEAVANNQFDDPRIQALVVHLRPCDERLLVDRTLGSLAAGDAIEDFLAHAHTVARATTLSAEAATILPAGPGDTGPRVIADDPTAARLVSERWGVDTPWEAAARTGSPVVWDQAGEPDTDLGREVAAAGYAGCWAYPIAPPEAADPAAVHVLWRQVPGPPEPSATMLAQQLVRLTQLALDRDERTRRLYHAARHDHLTGLANRAHFYDVVDRALAVEAQAVGVLYVDLDRFKAVNDRHGHGHGDRLLAVLAARLADGVPVGATTARLGGDEFAVCLPGATADTLIATADRLLVTMAAPVTVDGVDHAIGATLGLAVSAPGPSRSADRLVDAADRALLEGKAAGKATWRLAPTT